MIKRQFYALEHRSNEERQDSSSSSSSDSEGDAYHLQEEESLKEEETDGKEEEEGAESPADYSVDLDLVHNEFDQEESNRNGNEKTKDMQLRLATQWADAVESEFDEECVIMVKNVLKCKICPKTLCLSGATMRPHLSSKKHARAMKQFKAGKLKVILNSDGEEEEQGETHAERYVRTVASVKESAPIKRKRNSGRQRQRKRAKRRVLLAQKKGCRS